VKLRGAFDPKVQVAIGAVTTAVALSVVRLVWRLAPALHWTTDLRVLPWAFLAGALVGSVIGRYRLRALRTVLPEVNGRFFVSQGSVLSKLREGEIALKLQRLAIATAIIVWFATATYTDGRVVLYGSWCGYILGQLLAGQTLPFIRLWLELRRGQSTAPPG
jgi:hypothetical protein